MYCTASGRSLVPSDMGPTSLVADERDVLALEYGLRLIRRHARLLEDATGSVRSLARVPGVRAGEEETRLATLDDHRRVPIQRDLGHLDPLHGADDRAASTPLLNAQLGRAVVAGPDDGLARRDHGAASKQTRHVGRAAGSVRGSKNWPHVSSRRMPHSVSSAYSLSAQCVPAVVPAFVVVPNLHVLEHAACHSIGVECGHDPYAPITDGCYHVGITDE